MRDETIHKIVENYGMTVIERSEVIDSSHGEDDIRLTYIINQQYVLHCTSSKAITEEFLQDISRLVQRHLEIGVYAPKLYAMKASSGYLCTIEEDSVKYGCYMEELARYAFIDAQKADFYKTKENILPFLGKLASAYTNVDLSPVHSMWSIIDLSPFDEKVDEKQENIDFLCEILPDRSLSERIRFLNETARAHIKTYFEKLPRCVFQGDLNLSNILVDEKNHFKGLIDFNMFGTEVNINCFLNECMYYMEENDFAVYAAKELVERIESIQEKLMGRILEFYPLNDDERKTYADYKFVIMIGFYPNVMLMSEVLKGDQKQNVIEFLKLVCKRYENDIKAEEKL